MFTHLALGTLKKKACAPFSIIFIFCFYRICRCVVNLIIEDSIHNKAKISDKITQAINLEPKAKKFCPEPQPCTSRAQHLVPTHSMSYLVPTASSNFYDLPLSPTFTQAENESTKEVASTNVTQTVKFPSKSIQYRFENCTFTNCFNN